MYKPLDPLSVTEADCRKKTCFTIPFGIHWRILGSNLCQYRTQAAVVSMIIFCCCCFADSSLAQTTVAEKEPNAISQPAEGPVAVVVKATEQESRTLSKKSQKAAAAEATHGSQDLRFEHLPGYPRFKQIRDSSRKLQEGGRVYKIRWAQDGSKIGFTLNGQKKQFNVADESITDRTDNLVDKSLRDKVTARPKVERAKQVTSERSPDTNGEPSIATTTSCWNPKVRMRRR